MGRPKGFNREQILQKVIAVFWEKGFADTTLQDLERATGVNKSGLYSEFKNKEDLFLESLRYYLQTRGGEGILSAQPLGWANIQRFLELGQMCMNGQRGCFSVNSMRDVAVLPLEAREIIANSNLLLRRRIVSNIKAERPTANAGNLADAVMTFFSGICIEQNMEPAKAATSRRIASFMQFLREA